MPVPAPGQKTIPLADWKRFLRVADWYERTVEQGKGVLALGWGKSMVVKTPTDGIDGRDGTTMSSATCTRCVAAETATPGERTIHETTEELVVYNVHTSAVAGDTFFQTSLSSNGTRYIDAKQVFDRCNAILKGALASGSATTTVDNVVSTRGGSPVDSAAEELTVDNFFSWDADDNAVCKIEYNHDDDTWELYQVECPS